MLPEQHKKCFRENLSKPYKKAPQNYKNELI